MAQDDDFEPRLGRIRAQGGRQGKTYLSRVMRAAMLASGGAFGRAPRATRFTGARIGKGAGVGGVLAARDHLAAFRARRVIVKISTPKLAGKGLAAARAHLRYVQRDGVTRDGAPGQLYDAASDRADGRAFVDRAEQAKDVRQFRLIVSAEDGAEYDDLKPLTRRLMAQVEKDLGTKLDWVAVDHHNTGHPHTHIIVRGRNDQGEDLIIARNYLTQGIRERAAELVALDLGPRTDHEIEDRLRREVDQERLTSLDRGLLRDAGEDGLVLPSHADSLQHAMRTGRLQTLTRLGLAEPVKRGQWRLAPDLEAALRRMGERGDILKTLYRAVAEGGLERAAADQAIFEPAASRPLVGRVVQRGLADEVRDRHYLVVDGLDGRAHYVDIGAGDAIDPIPVGAVVRIEARPVEPRRVDHTVAEVAAAIDGRYSVDLHLAHDPTATAAFAETHVRRLEAMRRGRTGVEREADGTFRIAADHLDRATAYERRQAERSPVVVRTLSARPLDRQTAAIGATWLDRELTADTPELLRDAGFGREARAALAQRRQWLIDQGLASQQDGQVAFRAGLLGELQRRELAAAGQEIGGELGLPYSAARSGQRLDGVYRRAVDLVSGKFAVIERSRDFTLVPWRPVLDSHEGRAVSGLMRGDGVNWTLGRGRSGPSVS
jgi:type IV secretory pathway VirD2 relaxase